MRAFAIALLAAALLALTPLKVAFCACAEEKAGAALGVFPCAGGLALRLARELGTTVEELFHLE